MKATKGKKMGLTDPELIEKYERGKIDMKKPLKKLLRKPSKSAKKKG